MHLASITIFDIGGGGGGELHEMHLNSVGPFVIGEIGASHAVVDIGKSHRRIGLVHAAALDAFVYVVLYGDGGLDETIAV